MSSFLTFHSDFLLRKDFSIPTYILLSLSRCLPSRLFFIFQLQSLAMVQQHDSRDRDRFCLIWFWQTKRTSLLFLSVSKDVTASCSCLISIYSPGFSFSSDWSAAWNYSGKTSWTESCCKCVVLRQQNVCWKSSQGPWCCFDSINDCIVASDLIFRPIWWSTLLPCSLVLCPVCQGPLVYYLAWPPVPPLGFLAPAWAPAPPQLL